MERGNWGRVHECDDWEGGGFELASGNDFSIEACTRFPALRRVPESLDDVLRDRNDATSSCNVPVVDRFLIMPRLLVSRSSGHWCDVRFQGLQKSNRAIYSVV